MSGFKDSVRANPLVVVVALMSLVFMYFSGTAVYNVVLAIQSGINLDPFVYLSALACILIAIEKLSVASLIDEENHHAAARIMNKIFIVICFILAFVCFWYFVVFKVIPIARWNFFNYHFEEFDLFSRYVFISMMFDYSFTNLLFGINWMKKKFDVGFIPQLIYAIVAFALCLSLRFVCLGTDSAWLGLYLVFISLIAPILNLFFSKRRY